ncbi:DNA polymerase III subunit delta [Candidatus Saccharibacteria bacterium]|nr:DNA polymerase III subunit delta [Candidatus Saccharibacteria bacterium]
MIRTLTGQNSFILQQELQRIISEFVAEYTDMGLERLDGEEAEYDRIRESLESLPFLASKKLVVLRRPGVNKQFVENAERLLSDLPEMVDVVIVEPKLDKRLSYFKFLKKVTDFKEFNELESHLLVRWTVDYVKEQSGELSTTDATMLISRIGVNQQLLSNELAKLLLYNSKITKETILLLTDQTPQSSIFDLLDAALGGKTKRAIELYEEQRQQKVEPIQIIALLAWQLHALAIIKTAGDRDPATIAREAKLNPFVVRKSMGIAGRLTLTELKQLVHNVHLLDVRLKSESIDTDEAMLELIVSIGEI